ncbi:MAG: hypothetical protein NT154_21150 [Verrucomicrobia bacterium]|nr:hypothetical protein [Verrucomicrobiota bacterium]
MKTINTPIILTAALALLAQTGFAQSGAVDLTFMHRAGPNSNVNAVVVQPDGKVLFGGAFTSVNLTSRNRLARADANGEVDASFDPGSGPDGVVNALVLQSDGKVLIGGAFSSYNGTLRAGLARLNADGTLDATFDPGAGADGAVGFVAAQTNGQVLVQGSFTNFNGVPRLHLARLNADGGPDASFDPGSRAAAISALAWQPDGKVVFSGMFTNLDGLGGTNLARLNADGSLDTNFTAIVSLNARADSVVVQRDGNILLAGWFTVANGAPFNHIARLNPNGSLDYGFNPGTGPGLPVLSIFWWRLGGPPIRLVEQPDGQLLLWGNFTNFNGTVCSNAVRLNPDASLDSTFNPASGIFVSGSVPSLCVQANGQVLVTARSAPFLRRLRVDGAVDGDWMSESGANSSVRAIVLQSDGKSVQGGDFTMMNGLRRTRLARLFPDGRLDASFNPDLGAYGSVCSIVMQPDGKLVFGGKFTNVNGVVRINLARLNPDTSLDTSFDAGLGQNEWVQAVALQPDGKLLLSGHFIFGTNAENWTSLVRVNADGSRDAAYDVRLQELNETDTVRQPIALQSDGKLIISGSFSSVNDVARTNLARLNPDGSLDITFDPGLGAQPGDVDWDFWVMVTAVALQPDGKLLVGGNFTTWNGAARSCLVRLHSDGSLDETFASVVGGNDAYVRAILVQPDGRIQVGGYFSGPNGAGQKVARLNPDGRWDNTFNPGSDSDGYVVFCLALQSDGNLLIGGNFSSVGGVPRGHVARLINELAKLPVPTVTSAYVTSWIGANASLNVFLVGLPPFSFQWQLNGTNLPGQNSVDLKLTNLLATDAGRYTLVVSNASGMATSAPVRLTVLPASARPGTLDTTFAPGSGADNAVWSLMEQTDGKLLVTGFFGTFNGELHGGLVRLNRDGRVDTNFLASGVESGREVYWVLPQPEGKLLVGGWFNYFNGAPRTPLARVHPDGRLDDSFKNNLARLEPDGSLDSSFDPGAGADDYTWAIVLQPDGKILVGGSFTHFNGVSRGGITRLNANGSMDASFNPGTAANGEVDVIVLQPDGKMVIGGGFSAFNGVPRTHLARLNPDGSLDATFVPDAPAWLVGSIIYGVVLQADGKLVAGAWQSGSAAACVARFNPDGGLDSSFALGVCNSDGVWCMTGLANGQILIGGDFTDFNGLPAGRIVRLHGDEAITALLPFLLGTRWNAGVFELGLFGEAGRTYTIEASTGLPAFSVWTNLTSAGTNWLADPGSPATPQRFYRARATN